MHAALLANQAFLDHEPTLYRQLAAGLREEGLAVTRVLPGHSQESDLDNLDDDVAAAKPGQADDLVNFEDSRYAWLRKRRMAGAAEALRKRKVGLLHVLDRGLWEGAAGLAQALDIPAVFSVWSIADLSHVARYRPQAAAQRVVFAVASGPLAQAVIQHLEADAAVVEVVPPGVKPFPPQDVREPRPGSHRSRDKPLGPRRGEEQVLDSQTPLCAVISGDGVHDEAYEALFAGLAPVCEKHPESLFFLDDPDSEHDGHALWQRVSKLGLVSNFSQVPAGLARRELLLRAHALIYPQALGQVRLLPLQAMKHHVPVLALADPWLDHLIDDKNAWLVEEPKPELWTAMVERLIEDPQRTSQLVERASRWVAENADARDHWRRLTDLYRRVATDALPFKRGA